MWVIVLVTPASFCGFMPVTAHIHEAIGAWTLIVCICSHDCSLFVLGTWLIFNMRLPSIVCGNRE